MSENRSYLLQGLGCLLAVAVTLTFFARTYRAHWRLWLAAVLATALVLWVWGRLNGRRIRKLGAEYGLSIVYKHRDEAWAQAFRRHPRVHDPPLLR